MRLKLFHFGALFFSIAYSNEVLNSSEAALVDSLVSSVSLSSSSEVILVDSLVASVSLSSSSEVVLVDSLVSSVSLSSSSEVIVVDSLVASVSLSSSSEVVLVDSLVSSLSLSSSSEVVEVDSSSSSESLIEKKLDSEEKTILAPVELADDVGSGTLKSSEEEETYYGNSREFSVVQKGESRHDHSIELNLMGGIAESVWGYSVGYNKIIAGGYQELHFAATIVPAFAEIRSVDNNLVDPEIMFYSLGGAFRNFYDKIDEGIFWGLGARFSVWDYDYYREYTIASGGGEKQRKKEGSYATTMYLLSEIGFLHPINNEFGIKTNLEAGMMFNSDPYEEKGADFRFLKTRPYWNLQFGFVYQI
jgi:hypothetical protein